MRYLLTATLVALALTGCTSQSSAPTAASSAVPTATVTTTVTATIPNPRLYLDYLHSKGMPDLDSNNTDALDVSDSLCYFIDRGLGKESTASLVGPATSDRWLFDAAYDAAKQYMCDGTSE